MCENFQGKSLENGPLAKKKKEIGKKESNNRSEIPDRMQKYVCQSVSVRVFRDFELLR